MTWSEQTFLARVAEKNEPEVANAIQKIYEWARTRCRIVWGKGPVYGTMAVHYLASDINVKAVLITDPGSFYTTFAGLKKVAPFHEDRARYDLLARLNAVPGIHLPYEAIHKWWPGFRVRDLSLPEGAQQILDTLD
jgi:hypothetical protein